MRVPIWLLIVAGGLLVALVFLLGWRFAAAGGLGLAGVLAASQVRRARGLRAEAGRIETEAAALPSAREAADERRDELRQSAEAAARRAVREEIEERMRGRR